MLHATGLLSDANDVVMGIDLLEAMIVHLGDLPALHAQIFKRLGLAWTTLKLGSSCSLRGTLHRTL